MSPGLFCRLLLTRLAILALLGVPSMAPAQADPPGRVGRLNDAEGQVAYSPAGVNEWRDAELNRPLTRGDKLRTDKGTRAEIQVGSSVVRMDGGTQLEVLALDDQSAQLSVARGTVYVRVRTLPEGENFEIDTPNLAYRAAYPGDWRIDVDAAQGTTRVTIHSGTGAVYGDKGQALPLGGGQRVTFRTRALTQVNAQEAPPQDNFDRWAAERNRREDQSVAARYVPRDLVGYPLLDASGQWVQDAAHGTVWVPQNTPANWAPYRHGRWDWIAPWGWTWIDDAPWAFVTSHYGRWALAGERWAWVPGRMGLRPTYAPALVAFVGGNGVANLVIDGGPAIAWFPLAPGEAWQPGFPATPLYVSAVNGNMPPVQAGYAYQRKPEALTAVPLEDFHRGRPSRGSGLRVAADLLAQAQVVPPPPMSERGTAMVARAAPAASPPAELHPAAGNAPAAQPARRETKARRAEQGKREARAAPQRELQARRPEQARRVAAAKKDDEMRRIAHAQQVERARRAADHDAQVLREQREAWQRRQQALGEASKRDAQAGEEQQRQRAARQRGIPILNTGPAS